MENIIIIKSGDRAMKLTDRMRDVLRQCVTTGKHPYELGVARSGGAYFRMIDRMAQMGLLTRKRPNRLTDDGRRIGEAARRAWEAISKA